VLLAGSLPDVADPALARGPDGLAAFRLEVGRPLSPMLAAPGADLADALARTPHASVEWKLDGIRVQVHRDGERVAVFTRSLDDITARVPELVEVARSLPVRSVVLDGEALALLPDGRPAPFQVTASRAATRTADPAVRLTPWFFDVLHLDGEDLLAGRWSCAPSSSSRSRSTGCRPRRATPAAWRCASRACCGTGPTRRRTRPTPSTTSGGCTRRPGPLGPGGPRQHGDVLDAEGPGDSRQDARVAVVVDSWADARGESLLGGLACDAELSADLGPGRTGLAGSGDCGGQRLFGELGLLVRGGDPVQDVQGRADRQGEALLSFADARAVGVAGRAQRHRSQAHGRGQRASWS